jgi:pSer/pThr/pTyr-binding forkhead associated (FHA) protein
LQIGRTKSSAVYIKDPAVSQKHARIEWTGSAYTITDLGSSNGTTVNEKEIDENDPVEIRDGDVIVVGTDTTVKVFVAAAADQTKAEPETAPAKQPRGAAARAAAAAKREAEKARREEAAAKAARAREAKRAAAQAEEAARENDANESESAPLADRDESVTVEAFLTETAERLIGQMRDLAEAEVAALRKETEAVKAELRAECAAAA